MVSLLKELAIAAGQAAVKAVVKLIRKSDDGWAETPAPTRACPRCKEIAYSPGQVRCFKCGAML